jgi:hypothetical protein
METVWAGSGKARCIMLHGKGRRDGMTLVRIHPSKKRGEGVFEAIRRQDYRTSEEKSSWISV